MARLQLQVDAGDKWEGLLALHRTFAPADEEAREDLGEPSAERALVMGRFTDARPVGLWTGEAAETLMHDSQRTPRFVGEAKKRFWWLYQHSLYSTKEDDLGADDVKALIEEQKNKKRLRIARAKTVAAMEDGLDRKGTRQPIAQEVKVAVWQRDRGACVQCGSNEELEFDHIVPVARGGSSTERNVQLLCAACNREKGASL